MNVAAVQAGKAARATARVTGVIYLYMIAAGVFAEAVVRGAIVDYADAAATARAFIVNETLYRWGFTAEFLLLAADTTIAALLYVVLKPAGPTISLLAAYFRLALGALAAVRFVLLAAPLTILSGGDYWAAFTPAQVETLALLCFRLHGLAYNLCLLMFGFCCLLKGWLVWRAHFLPSALGALLAMAGVCYLINSFANLLFPDVAGALFPWVLLPCFVAELAFGLWLAIVGVNPAKWEAQAAA